MTKAQQHSAIKTAYFEWRDAGNVGPFVYDGREWKAKFSKTRSKSGKTSYWDSTFISDDLEISRLDDGHCEANHGWHYYVGPPTGNA
jgi:hypothetical protein